MKAKLYIGFILLLLNGSSLFCQIEGIDSSHHGHDHDHEIDSLTVQVDSLVASADSLVAPSRETYKVSSDGLDAPVEYISDDSMEYDIKNQQIHLYGNATVTYTSINLTADYILLDWATNTVIAEGLPNEKGKIVGHPQFTDGSETFEAKKIKYNFETRKGIITEATNLYNDVYIRSEKGKFISSDPSDSTRTDDRLNGGNSIFTTCNLETPHFGIRSTKQKIVPNKTIVVGPSNLEIGGVPSPLWLPFGFFPIAKRAQAGLIVPRDYEFNEQLGGFGLSNIGYFTPLGPNFNLQVTGDIYVKGSWGLHLRSQYNKRYKYNGVFSFDVGSLRQEQSDLSFARDNSFSLTWNHNQDRAAHPTRKFGGNINIQVRNYQRTFNNDANNVLNNTLRSSLTYNFTPIEAPYNFTASFTHDQSNQNRRITVNFPNLDFNMRRVFPFKRKNAIGKERWYEKIGTTYRANTRNRYQTSDTTFLQGTIPDILQQMDFGAQHRADANTTFNVLKYFRITPSVNYTQTFLPRKQDITFDDATLITIRDTVFNPSDSSEFTLEFDTTFGKQIIDTLNSFSALQTFSSSVSLGFDFFSTVLFKKGKLKGIRHFGKPNLSLNYSPNWNQRFIDSVLFDNRFIDSLEAFNRVLPNGLYSVSGISGEQFAIGYGLSNVFQSKYLGRDSTLKYSNIIDELSFNGNYNFLADSLQFSTINARLRGNWFRNFLNITISAQFDPYERDNGRRLNRLTINRAGRRRLVDFVSASLPVTNRFTVRQIRGWLRGDDKEEEIDPTEQRRQQQERGNIRDLDEIADFWSLFDNFSLSHNITLNYARIGAIGEKRDTFRITANSIRVRGNLQITPKWNVRIDNLSYDFNNNSIVYPSFQFYRDLHCWEMGLGWQPARGTYSFYLRVKSGSLGFIELPYQQRNFNNFGGF